MSFVILFFIATAVNVTLSTIRSLVTIKGTKLSAAVINDITYGFYTYVIILTNGDGISTLVKMLITAVCNFICVYLVKWIDEKRIPEKMWKIEVAIPETCGVSPTAIKNQFELFGVSNNYSIIGHWIIFNCYCEKCAQTDAVLKLAKKYNGKVSAYESKI